MFSNDQDDREADQVIAECNADAETARKAAEESPPADAGPKPTTYGPECELRVLRAKELSFVLTDEDIVKMAREASQVISDVDKDKLAFEQVKEEWKDQIKAKEVRVHDLMRTVHEGKERRTVACYEVKNYSEFFIAYYHDGKEVERRPMEVHERQPELPLKGVQDFQPRHREDELEEAGATTGAPVLPGKMH